MCSNSKVAAKEVLPLWLLVIVLTLVATKIGGTVAFVAIRTNNIANGHLVNIPCGENTDDFVCGNGVIRLRTENDRHRRRRQRFPLRDANPGVGCELRSSYPPGTPAGLRGEAVRSALVTTERCIGWNLSSNAETSMGGLLEVSGRGTIDFLNGKLTRDFRNSGGGSSNGISFREACLLDAKGRLIDVLRVTLDDDNRRALVLTSPGHSSADLLKRLDPFVFPMDEVALTNFCNENIDDNGENHSFAFTLASTQYKHVQKAMREQSNLSLETNEMVFPGTSQSVVWKPQGNGDGEVQILVVPSTGIASAACVGYTFVFFGSGSAAATLGRNLWEHLVSEDNPEGPIEVGALEYETLRVEAGQPAYGQEYGIDLALKRKKKREQATGTGTSANDEDGKKNAKRKKKKPGDELIKTSPFELHFDPLIDLDKGCYLGQEGIASVLRNPRGSPRTLYTVVFEDDFNTYESQSRGDESDFDNLTTVPKSGQTLYALGSNEKLNVGTLTSLGEAGGTGSRFTVGLALIKRADAIRKQMKTLDLEIPRDADDFLDVDFASGSGIIQPPPMDALEGLEVIVEGTFTIGILKGIPTRQSGMRRNSNMYDADIEVEGVEECKSVISSSSASTTASPGADVAEPEVASEVVPGDMDAGDGTLADLEQIEAEVAQATAEAEAAAGEANRKIEKMEMLKKRAEEAMARRKEKVDAAAEAKRKAEKMELLKQRAEEAMARRKGKATKNKEEPATELEEKEDSLAAEARRKAEKMEMLKKRAEEAMARRKAKK